MKKLKLWRKVYVWLQAYEIKQNEEIPAFILKASVLYYLRWIAVTLSIQTCQSSYSSEWVGGTKKDNFSKTFISLIKSFEGKFTIYTLEY